MKRIKLKKKRSRKERDVGQIKPITSLEINCIDSKGSRDWETEVKERLRGERKNGKKRERNRDVGLSRGSQHAV